MSDYRKDDRGNLMRKVGEFVHLVFGKWIIAETPHGARTVPESEWSGCADISRVEYAKAIMTVVDDRRKSSEIQAYGILVPDSSERVTHVTPTQIVTTSRRYKRGGKKAGDQIGGSRFTRLPKETVDEVERRAAGRKRVDFIAEGKKSAQASSTGSTAGGGSSS